MFKFILILLVRFTLLNSSIIEDESLSMHADPITVENVAFVKIGTYSKLLAAISLNKTYFKVIRINVVAET